MKFGILVNEGPYQHQASDSAYMFAKAAIAKGHEVFRVFFYHDGVNNSTRLTVPPADDRNIVNRWAALAEEHKIDMVVCIAAAQRRGLMDENEAKRQGKDANNIHPAFRISGLGQLVEAGIQCDRLVTFGD
ncbi:MAG: sulfurtransferase complex subunit TusD [Pseudomonadota bacterium]